MLIRDATAADAAACADIYAPYVIDTAISFEELPPSAAAMAERIESSIRSHAWLVAEAGGEILGYAYASSWKTRAAYQWACEASVYIDGARRGSGIGRSLYAALFDRLRERGYRTVLGGVAMPNPASEKLHRSMGFEQVSLYRRAGFKLGRWHDVAWFQLFLTSEDDDGDPGPAPADR